VKPLSIVPEGRGRENTCDCFSWPMKVPERNIFTFSIHIFSMISKSALVNMAMNIWDLVPWSELVAMMSNASKLFYS
jgi:hypothetical protein